MSCFFGHQWTPWKPYTQEFNTEKLPNRVLVETRQTRRCTACGYSQDEFVASGRSNLATETVKT